MVFPLVPSRGGFQRSVGCGPFVKGYLIANGAGTQSDIFRAYKTELLYQRAVDRATRYEEKLAKRQKRRINPDAIDTLIGRFQTQLRFKSNACRYHSFVSYFGLLKRLRWVEPTGQAEESNFVEGQPRKYYRITESGAAADWSNPHRSLYG